MSFILTLTIDLETVKNAYKSFQVNDVDWMKSDHNIEDAITNIKTQSI